MDLKILGAAVATTLQRHLGRVDGSLAMALFDAVRESANPSLEDRGVVWEEPGRVAVVGLCVPIKYGDEVLESLTLRRMNGGSLRALDGLQDQSRQLGLIAAASGQPVSIVERLDSYDVITCYAVALELMEHPHHGLDAARGILQRFEAETLIRAGARPSTPSDGPAPSASVGMVSTAPPHGPEASHDQSRSARSTSCSPPSMAGLPGSSTLSRSRTSVDGVTPRQKNSGAESG